MVSGNKGTSMTTTYTYDDQTVSDLHKDAYGFRPTGGFWAQWEASTADQKQATWDSLCQTLDRELAYEAEAREKAIEAFEARVAELIEFGAGDRATAIRWLADSVDHDPRYGLEDVEWTFNLPYGYLAPIFRAA
jgi:hypothetical protein